MLKRFFRGIKLGGLVAMLGTVVAALFFGVTGLSVANICFISTMVMLVGVVGEAALN